MYSEEKRFRYTFFADEMGMNANTSKLLNKKFDVVHNERSENFFLLNCKSGKEVDDDEDEGKKKTE